MNILLNLFSAKAASMRSNPSYPHLTTKLKGANETEPGSSPSTPLIVILSLFEVGNDALASKIGS